MESVVEGYRHASFLEEVREDGPFFASGIKAGLWGRNDVAALLTADSQSRVQIARDAFEVPMRARIDERLRGLGFDPATHTDMVSAQRACEGMTMEPPGARSVEIGCDYLHTFDLRALAARSPRLAIYLWQTLRNPPLHVPTPADQAGCASWELSVFYECLESQPTGRDSVARAAVETWVEDMGEDAGESIDDYATQQGAPLVRVARTMGRCMRRDQYLSKQAMAEPVVSGRIQQGIVDVCRRLRRIERDPNLVIHRPEECLAPEMIVNIILTDDDAELTDHVLDSVNDGAGEAPGGCREVGQVEDVIGFAAHWRLLECVHHEVSELLSPLEAESSDSSLQ